jgi:3-oxoacyl-[acyl-carrier protein] reductase
MSRGNLTFDFTGRTVLVTGAARGIGLAVSRGFADAGADVVMVDRDADELTAVAAGLGARPVACDVSSTADVERAVAEAVQSSGRLDVVVNNAGVLRDKVLWQLTDDDWDRSSVSTPAALSGSPARRRPGSVPKVTGAWST